MRYHAHGPDPELPTSRNAGAGPVYRQRIGTHYIDGHGNRYNQNVANNSNSPVFSEEAADATHIPYPAGLRPPGAERFLLPNPISLADGVGNGGNSR